MRNPIKYSFFDEKIRPINFIDDVSSLYLNYNLKGDNIQESYFDINGKSCSLNGNYKINYEYDNRGNEIKCFFLDHSNSISTSTYYNYAIATYKYDKFGNQTDNIYFDDNNNRLGKTIKSYDFDRTLIKNNYYSNDFYGNKLDPYKMEIVKESIKTIKW